MPHFMSLKSRRIHLLLSVPHPSWCLPTYVIGHLSHHLLARSPSFDLHIFEIRPALRLPTIDFPVHVMCEEWDGRANIMPSGGAWGRAEVEVLSACGLFHQKKKAALFYTRRLLFAHSDPPAHSSALLLPFVNKSARRAAPHRDSPFFYPRTTTMSPDSETLPSRLQIPV
ncbi:hypothetical protein K491DRAFT_734664 [Lophiostoma macrostomum CBS 122681]|uniref:Uncharacterized protein n=1 Tax=Lophiostoma macrostomum CBS 122681 TaxID=1314788 RepID=A0A6A6SR22_9PLEO|nr:hypothetical protein K491DRAFT_734664 [Lophiostoma macrostomum CBS 122681]